MAAETEPIKIKLTPKERAERRRKKLMNSEQDRIGTILGDRIAPSDDFKVPKKEEEKEMDNANGNNIFNNNSNNSGPKGMPDISQIADLMMSGSMGGEEAISESWFSKSVNRISDIIIVTTLVLISNGIINESHANFLKDAPKLTTVNLFLTLTIYNTTKYILLQQNYKYSKTFRGAAVALRLLLKESTLKLVLVTTYILTNSVKSWCMFLIVHVMVFNFFTAPNQGPMDTEGIYEEEPVIELD